MNCSLLCRPLFFTSLAIVIAAFASSAVMRKRPVITDVLIEVANAVEARFQEPKEALR
jgi:hypothetical protein